MLMKKQLFFWFIAVVCILASCSKDDLSDPSMVTEKAGHVKGPVTYLNPSGGDDTQAFVDAFAAATPGSVIQLAPGVFHVSYIEVFGFKGSLIGSGKDNTFISLYGLIDQVSQIDLNLLPAWVKFIGGDVTLSDFSFKTGDGPLIEDSDPFYKEVLISLLLVNNYNPEYYPDDPQPMNFTMKDVNFLCGYLDPELSYMGQPYNVLMPIWLGTDVYWPLEDIPLTSGRYNINNCHVDNAYQGFEAFSLGEEALLTIDHCSTDNCLYGAYFTANYNSRIYISNNIFKDTKGVGLQIEDNDWGLVGYVVSFRSCEYVVTGNVFSPMPESPSLILKDSRGVIYPDRYLPVLALVKNNLFKLTEGSTGISCLNNQNAVVKNNRFTGSGISGVYVDGAPVYDVWTGAELGSGESKNVLILGNNFNGLTATEAGIVLGELSSDCTVVGNGKNDVIDLGTNNKIVGMKMVPGGNHAGPTIRDNFRMMPGPGHHPHH